MKEHNFIINRVTLVLIKKCIVKTYNLRQSMVDFKANLVQFCHEFGISKIAGMFF